MPERNFILLKKAGKAVFDTFSVILNPSVKLRTISVKYFILTEKEPLCEDRPERNEGLRIAD